LRFVSLSSRMEDSPVTEVGVGDDEECRICRGGPDIGPLVSVGLQLTRSISSMHARLCK